MESIEFTWDLHGSRPDSPFDAHGDDPEWAFTSAADDSPTQLYEQYDTVVDRSRERLRAALDSGGLDQPTHRGEEWGGTLSLRRLVFDLVEEYGRHTGHADLLREAIDGRVGEDPPHDWLPTRPS